MNTTRVLCVHMGSTRPPGGCEIYRANMPLDYLGRQDGWETGWLYFDEFFGDFVRRGPIAWYEEISRYDVIVFPRAYVPDGNEGAKSALGALFSLIRAMGKRIVYEVDDDYSNEHRVVVSGDTFTPPRWSDAITVTTPYLADTYRRISGRPTHVLPNCLDPALWNSNQDSVRGPELEGKIVIGLTGSPTHYNDWSVLAEPLRQILTDERVRLVLMGFKPDYLEGLPNSTYVPPMGYENYCQIIRACDIILASVDPSDLFNMGKSPIKAVEGQGARRTLPNGKIGGAAVIATDNPVYRLAVKDGKTGLLVKHDPDSWLSAIRRVVENDEMRFDMQRAGHASAWKDHDISKEWRQWARAYRKVIASPQNSAKIPLTPPFHSER